MNKGYIFSKKSSYNIINTMVFFSEFFKKFEIKFLDLQISSSMELELQTSTLLICSPIQQKTTIMSLFVLAKVAIRISKINQASHTGI
jgi:hypothetical protein